MQLEIYQIVRELLAGSLFILNLYLFWSFASKVTASMAQKSWRCLRNDPATQGASALATYFLGALILRGWDWAVYIFTNYILTNPNSNTIYLNMENYIWISRRSWGITVLAGVIIIVGGFCCVRVFNPKSRANWMMATVAVVATLVPVGLHLLMFGWPL